MSQENPSEVAKKQQKARRNSEIHARNVISDMPSNDPRTLKYIVDNEDTPSLSDDSLDFMLNKIISTSNLSTEQTRGFEWENEIAMLRREELYPPEYGLTGWLRAFAFDDANEYKMPLSKTEKIKQQGLATLSKYAATRSEEFIGVETSTKNLSESIVSDEETESSGGLGSRLSR